MALRDTLGHCLESSMAEQQPLHIREQLRVRGKAPKLTAGFRTVPMPIRRFVQSAASRGSMPVNAVGARPKAYGFEAILHTAGEKQDVVIKRYHQGNDVLESLAKQRRRHQMYLQCFGQQVVSTSFLLMESQYRKGEAVIAAVQPVIEGLPFFDNISSASPSQIATLHYGAQRMLNEFGWQPDFNNADNVLVDSDGNLNIVDTSGMVLPEDVPEKASRTVVHLARLAAAVEGTGQYEVYPAAS